MKFVKPQELNLDLINPNSSKGYKGAGSSLGPVTMTNHGQSNVQSILNNLRTPQNQIGSLNMYSSKGGSKELPGIHQRSNSNARGGIDREDGLASDLNSLKKRNASGNHRMAAYGGMSPQAMV